VGTINLESVSAVLPQLFAEARERYKRGEDWWQESGEVRREAADKREGVREIGPWEEKIAQFVTSHPGSLHMADILGSACLDIPAERQTRAQSTRVGLILHRLGYQRTQRRTPENMEKREVFTSKKKKLDVCVTTVTTQKCLRTLFIRPYTAMFMCIGNTNTSTYVSHT
jgi:predicted P-loop ATPase